MSNRPLPDPLDLPWWAILGLGAVSVGAAALLINWATEQTARHCCHQCNAIVIGRPSRCPHCGAAFEWAGSAAGAQA
jgi:hypothetical protein